MNWLIASRVGRPPASVDSISSSMLALTVLSSARTPRLSLMLFPILLEMFLAVVSSEAIILSRWKSSILFSLKAVPPPFASSRDIIRFEIISLTTAAEGELKNAGSNGTTTFSASEAEPTEIRYEPFSSLPNSFDHIATSRTILSATRSATIRASRMSRAVVWSAMYFGLPVGLLFSSVSCVVL